MVMVVGVAVMVTGCAYTNLTSFKDPDFSSKRYIKIAVFSNASDLAWRKQIELNMVKELQNRGVTAMPGFEIIPPTRANDGETFLKAIDQNNVDSILCIRVTDIGVNSTFVPGQTTTTTSGKASLLYRQIEYQEKTNTYTSPGFIAVSHPRADIESTLIDARTGRKAWIASGETSGNGLAKFSNVIDDYCKSVAERLVADGVISKKENTVQKQETPSLFKW